jgi:hypothetical protein
MNGPLTILMRSGLASILNDTSNTYCICHVIID